MARDSLKGNDGESTQVDEEEKDPSILKSNQGRIALRTLALILLYLVHSIGLTFYQRALLKNFHFPLSVVLCHLALKFLMAALCRVIWEWHTGKPRTLAPWRRYISRLAPVGVTSGFDIGLSNWGLELITVSLYTMTKSTTIVFILIFSLIFKLEKKSWSLVLIVLLIASGLTMFTYKATEFNTLGFTLVLIASFMSGVRWTLAQVVMQHSDMGQQNPLDMVYHVQPWMIMALLPFAAIFEGPSVASSCMVFGASDIHVALNTALRVGMGAFIAFAMEVSEYLVVVNTSSLTLSIVGVFKEVCTLVLAVEWTGDHVSAVNVLGLIICLGGISSHVAHKIRVSRREGSPVRKLNTNEGSTVNFEMSEPLLAEDASGMYMISSSGEDSDENSDILYVLGQRDRPPPI